MSSSSDGIRFTVPGQPVAKARARVATRDKHGRALAKATSYTPKNSAEYSALVRAHAVKAMLDHDRIESPLKMLLVVRLTIPKSWPKWKREQAANGELLPTGKPDLSNFVKQIEDACNGVVYRDDGQIVTSGERKIYAPDPDLVGVSVNFQALEGYESA